ncbi:hypothetical protein M5K25_006533 [Dendrobium thyrsiflorum]|uniref:Uncharacterized protein n=1 Tax=Dendrobium thyrsiflorum TaxID=117978 RepID=A0ABD0VIU2_DENTH
MSALLERSFGTTIPSSIPTLQKALFGPSPPSSCSTGRSTSKAKNITFFLPPTLVNSRQQWQIPDSEHLDNRSLLIPSLSCHCGSRDQACAKIDSLRGMSCNRVSKKVPSNLLVSSITTSEVKITNHQVSSVSHSGVNIVNKNSVVNDSMVDLVSKLEDLPIVTSQAIVSPGDEISLLKEFLNDTVKESDYSTQKVFKLSAVSDVFAAPSVGSTINDLYHKLCNLKCSIKSQPWVSSKLVSDNISDVKKKQSMILHEIQHSPFDIQLNDALREVFFSLIPVVIDLPSLFGGSWLLKFRMGAEFGLFIQAFVEIEA